MHRSSSSHIEDGENAGREKKKKKQKRLLSPEYGSGRHNVPACLRIKVFNSSLNALTWWPETAFRADHQEKSCLVGCNSPSPKWVPGALRGDEQINAKCHFGMMETQGVTSLTAFTATLRADGQKQAIRRKMPISPLHSQKVSQPNTNFSAALREKS